MKKYGIYLLYPPTVDLRSDGLGRHLSCFLKASQTKENVKFIIIAPSWMRSALVNLFTDYNISNNAFEIITPTHIPILLRIYFWLTEAKKTLNLIKTNIRKCWKKNNKEKNEWEDDWKKNYKFSLLLKLFSLSYVIIGAILLLLIAFFSKIKTVLGVALFLAIMFKLCNKVFYSIRAKIANSKYRNIIKLIINYTQTLNPSSLCNSKFFRMLLMLLQESESLKIHNIISKRKDILAWYSPTMFWPSFNDIDAPKLITAPDVVLNEFPIDFAIYAPGLYLQYKNVIQTIFQGEYFATYSKYIKYNTLVKNYGVMPDNIFVIPHGVNKLNNLIDVDHPLDKKQATKEFAKQLFNQALLTIQDHHFASEVYANSELRFIFYASQARPNKNIISLLKAYEYLLRKKYISHKLVLTCNRYIIYEINRYISEKHLENDVLFLHGISTQQLAACYKLADIAVNPSLSEGGMPFTFTEALSVGTPVVMSRIDVTEEIIVEPILKEAMLFDPYDWKDIADTIYRGLMNPQKLLDLQIPFYEKLAERSWDDVVSDTISALDKIINLKKNKNE